MHAEEPAVASGHGWTWRTFAWTASSRGGSAGQVIDLTQREFDLLELLLRHPGQVLRRETIFEDVWGYDYLGDSNVIDVYIGHLRQEDRCRLRAEAAAHRSRGGLHAAEAAVTSLSVRARVALSTAIVALFVLIGTGVVIYRELGHTLTNQALEQARHDDSGSRASSTPAAGSRTEQPSP